MGSTKKLMLWDDGFSRYESILTLYHTISDGRTNGNHELDYTTEQNNITAVFYMRIK